LLLLVIGATVFSSPGAAIEGDAAVASVGLAQPAIADGVAPLALAPAAQVAVFPVVLMAILTGTVIFLGSPDRALDRAAAWTVAVVGVLITGLAGFGALRSELVVHSPHVVVPTVAVLVALSVVSADGRLLGPGGVVEEWSPSTTTGVATAVALVGVATLVLLVGFGVETTTGDVLAGLLIPGAAAYAALGVAVVVVRSVGPLTSRTALVPVPAALAVGTVVGLVSGGVDPRTVRDVLQILGFGVPPFLFYALGVAVRRGARERWPLAGSIVVGPVLVVIGRGPWEGGPFFYPSIWWMFSAVLIVLLTVFVVPIYALGWIVADEATERDGGTGEA